MTGEQLPMAWGRESWSDQQIRDFLDKATGRKEEADGDDKTRATDSRDG